MNKAVELARQCIGMKEADGSFKPIIDTYNTVRPLPRGYAMKYTDAWCATFISYLGIKLRMTDVIPPECSCERQIELFKKIGCWQEDESIVPQEGYIIYYDWQDTGKGNNTGWSDHVGIVESCDGKNIVVIEGNNADSVKRRTIAVNARYIRGYAIPKYPVEPKADIGKVEGFVDRMYTIALEREPDPQGRHDWVTAVVDRGTSATEVARGFFYSIEFIRKNYSNETYVDKLYLTLLARQPDAEGKKSWIKLLDTGTSRDEVFNGFVNSQEFTKLCEYYNIKK